MSSWTDSKEGDHFGYGRVTEQLVPKRLSTFGRTNANNGRR